MEKKSGIDLGQLILTNILEYSIQGYSQMTINVNGPTAGAVKGAQHTIFGVTQVVLNFNGYENDTTSNQTIDFLYNFTQTPTIGSNDTGLVISADVNGITITAPDNTTLYSGNVKIFGI